MDKENKGLISVIVPVYNVEPYLRRCLDSIINQTYRNIEILLVDDGSTDKSGLICDEYAGIDNQVKVFHKKNGGAASARNVGLNHAKGEFIGFVDSDDYIDLDMYETLLQFMADEVDMVSCGIVFEEPNKKKRVQNLVCGGAKFTREQAIEQLLLFKAFSFSQCDKLFRSHLFEGIWYPVGRVSEDLPVLYELYIRSRNIVNCGKAKYHYVQRTDSISRRSFFYRRIDNTIFSGKICKDVSKTFPGLKEVAESFYWKSVVKMIDNIQSCENRDEFINLEKMLKKEAIKSFVHNWNNKYIEKERRDLFWQCIKR